MPKPAAADKNPLARAVPCGHRLIVRRERPSKTTAGGILLPDTAVLEKMQGTVLAVGPGKWVEGGELRRRPIDVKVGDRVVFTRYAGAPIEDEVRLYPNDEYSYMVVADDEIVCVLPPDNG